MNRLKKVFILITILFTSSNITNAQEINIDEYGNSQQTEMVERKENDEMDNTDPNQSLRAARAALTVPKEGLSDRKQDIKNSSGIMSERRFFYKNRLVEKRLYSYSSTNGYRMTTKHLYWSNGSTIERTRTYKYTAKNEIYIVNTKRYTATNKIDWHIIYDGTLAAKILEGRYYDVTGTYFTHINYFKNGIMSSRNYWKGSAPNKITSVVKYNATGKEWTNATYYHDYNTKKIGRVTNYKATSPNYKLNETNYLENGTKDWYIVYGENNNRHDLTYYNEDGTKDREIRYHKNSAIWDYEVKYQEKNKKKSTTYRDTNNNIIQKNTFNDDGNVIEREFFKNNEISYVEYINEQGIMYQKDVYKEENNELIIISTLYDEKGNEANTVNISDYNLSEDETKKIDSGNYDFVLNEDGKYSIEPAINFQINQETTEYNPNEIKDNEMQANNDYIFYFYKYRAVKNKTTFPVKTSTVIQWVRLSPGEKSSFTRSMTSTYKSTASITVSGKIGPAQVGATVGFEIGKSTTTGQSKEVKAPKLYKKKKYKWYYEYQHPGYQSV